MTVGYALRYHWPWLVGTVVIALLLAGAIAHEQKPVYQSTALVQLDAPDQVTQGSIDVTTQETRATNLIQVIEGTPFLTKVCKAESKQGISCSAGALQSQMSVSLVKSTTMLAITVSAPRAGWAASLANAIATATVQERLQEARQYYGTSIDTREAQTTTAGKEITQLQQQIAAIAANPGIPSAQLPIITAPYESQLSIMQGQYEALSATQESLEQALIAAESEVVVAQRATVPSQSSGPSLKRYLAAGLGAGLVLGFLLMLVVARLDRRVRHGQRLASAAGLPVVCELPRGRSLLETEEACAPAVAGLLGRRPQARSVLLVPADTAAEMESVTGLVGDVLVSFGRDVRTVLEEGVPRPSKHGSEAGSQVEVATPVTALEMLPRPNQGLPGKGQSDVVVFGTATPGQSSLALMLAPRVDLVVLVASGPKARGAVDGAVALMRLVAGAPPEQVARVGVVERAAALLRHSGADIAAGILICGSGRLPEPSAAPLPEPAAETA